MIKNKIKIKNRRLPMNPAPLIPMGERVSERQAKGIRVALFQRALCQKRRANFHETGYNSPSPQGRGGVRGNKALILLRMHATAQALVTVARSTNRESFPWSGTFRDGLPKQKGQRRFAALAWMDLLSRWIQFDCRPATPL